MQIPQRVGDEVRVRRARWRVAGIAPHETCTLLTLAGIGAANAGAEFQVIVPFDRVEPVKDVPRLRLVGHRQWGYAYRALIAEPATPDAPRTLRTADLEPLAFQLEPVQAVLRGEASRVLLADDVGLGKTIQAALIATELMARGEADRILILTPAGLREQWRAELATRFHTDATIVDARTLRLRATELPPGFNPWSTISVAIASIDYVKRPDVLPAVSACRWDLVVIDEAHGAVLASDRHAAAQTIGGRAAYVALLTATPHSGDADAFRSLSAIGGLGDTLRVFRRTRETVGLGTTRHVHQLAVRSSLAERRMHASLERFADAVRREGGADPHATSLGLTVLRKRALSSAHSLEQTITRRLTALGESRTSDSQMHLPFDDGQGEFDTGDLDPEWAIPSLANADDERQLLQAIAERAREAMEDESKLRVLRRLLGRLRGRDESAVVFTEYRDTLHQLTERFPWEYVALHGGMSRPDRSIAIEAFTSGRVRVLLATDAAGEGLNLHQTCRTVVNVELPWNPVRLEQRAGRVDRIGQHRPVHVFHLIARDAGEDAMVDRLRARVLRARGEIDTGDPLEPRRPPCRSSGTEHGGPQIGERLKRPTQIQGTGAAGSRGVGPERAHVLLTFAKGSRIRAWLGSRVLALVRTDLRDTCGRVLATHVAPLLVETVAWPPRQERRALFLRLWRDIDARAVGLCASSREEWLAGSLAICRRFRETQRARELAIWQALSGDKAAPLQPGLFDRRALRDREEWSERHGEAVHEAAWRASSSDPHRDPEASAPRTVLLLAP